MATKTATAVTLGATFRHLIADAHVLFEVTKIDTTRARVTAVAVNEPYDNGGVSYDSEYAGETRDFLLEEVEAQVARQAALDSFFTNAKNEEDRFWGAARVGDTLHYLHSFNQWIRGVVALDGDNKKGFQPTALVGDWRRHDLYTVRIDGTVDRGYHARKIIEGDVWRPRVGDFYENGARRQKPGQPPTDPTTLPALDLNPPAPTPEQEAEYAKGAQVTALREVLNDYTLSPDQALAKVRDLLAGEK